MTILARIDGALRQYYDDHDASPTRLTLGKGALDALLRGTPGGLYGRGALYGMKVVVSDTAPEQFVYVDCPP